MSSVCVRVAFLWFLPTDPMTQCASLSGLVLALVGVSIQSIHLLAPLTLHSGRLGHNPAVSGRKCSYTQDEWLVYRVATNYQRIHMDIYTGE